MACVRRYSRAIALALLGLAGSVFGPALAEDQGTNAGTDLYDHPVLAIDPGMHTATIWSQAVDAGGKYAVTGGADRTVRIWSIADRKLLRTVFIPIGPNPVGLIYAVAISPNGTTIAVSGYTESLSPAKAIYLFDRESGEMVGRIHEDLPDVINSLTFSSDGSRLAAVLTGGAGLRVFSGNREWNEVGRDDSYFRRGYDLAFAPDGRLATTSADETIRLYDSTFHLIRKHEAPRGNRPRGAAFSPDGKILAVGYGDAALVHLLDGQSLDRLPSPSSANLAGKESGFSKVAWSHDGQRLFAAGEVRDNGQAVVLAWNRAGLGEEERLPYCAQDSVAGLAPLPDGKILVASQAPCLGLMDTDGKPVWTVASPILDFRGHADDMHVSEDGKVIDFGYGRSAGPVLRFDVRSLALSRSPPNDALTFAPNRVGLTIGALPDGTKPTPGGPAPSFPQYDNPRSGAIAPDAKRRFLGSDWALAAFDDAGAQKWRWNSLTAVWAVNASKDGRVVVSADGGGAIRWRRADNGRELLALQVLPNKGDPAKWDWVLWTPEGFYEATPGAQDVLKWVTNHGPDKAATTLPVSAIARLHRPNALPHVLDQLETAHALGVDDISQARFDVQAATGSAKPPGGVLHVLAIGVDKFGDKAGDLHLKYAAEDAHDVAMALLESQKGSPSKASLYADIDLQYLPNDKADSAAVLDALDAMAQSMAKNEQGQDVAVILVSSHGEMIDGQFYLIPYGFDAGSQGKSIKTAVSASEFAKKVQALAAHGKVLVLLDACHSGAVGAQTWATDPDAKVLQDAMNMENVTVLTSSKKNELSEELPEWKHGALAEAFLDALKGAANSEGIVKLSALADAMENEVQSLTKGKQHLGMHVNFSGDLFVAGHY